ncbi:transcriptional regulator [archaeon SCG-AAA382B04]|nr:transcriptional regulator [archaeon SCG-AAA382B04]
MKQPCESIVIEILPTIRAELSKRLKQREVSQGEIAEALGVTTAAVSQYIHKRRGDDFALRRDTQRLIDDTAQAIAGAEVENTTEEICNICRHIKEKRLRCSEKSRRTEKEQPREREWLISSQL